MKTCACCQTACADDAPTCPLCGEASWLAVDVVAEANGPAMGAAAEKPAKRKGDR